MDTTPRLERLQGIRNRWFTDSLGIEFPDIGLPHPATCDELVHSERIASSFSATADAPDVVGLAPGDALAADRAANAARYGVEDPRGLLAELSMQIEKAPTALVEPEIIKKAFILLRELKADSEALTVFPDPVVVRNHLAEAAAIGKAEQVVSDLAAELGISLPINREVRRKR